MCFSQCLARPRAMACGFDAKVRTNDWNLSLRTRTDQSEWHHPCVGYVFIMNSHATGDDPHVYYRCRRQTSSERPLQRTAPLYTNLLSVIAIYLIKTGWSWHQNQGRSDDDVSITWLSLFTTRWHNSSSAAWDSSDKESWSACEARRDYLSNDHLRIDM